MPDRAEVKPSPAGVPGAVTDPELLEAFDLDFAGAQGTPVNGYLARPAGAARPLPGMIVIHEAGGLGEHIKDVTNRVAKTLIDLTEVEMVTTPALSMFLAAASAAKNSGGRLIFTESRPPVRDILKRLRLHSVLQTVPGYEEALAEARRK